MRGYSSSPPPPTVGPGGWGVLKKRKVEPKDKSQAWPPGGRRAKAIPSPLGTFPSGPSSTECKGSFFLLKGKQGSTFLSELLEAIASFDMPQEKESEFTEVWDGTGCQKTRLKGTQEGLGAGEENFLCPSLNFLQRGRTPKAGQPFLGV